jgi:hypothetical protein
MFLLWQKEVYITIENRLAIKVIGELSKVDAQKLEGSLRSWLGL